MRKTICLLIEQECHSGGKKRQRLSETSQTIQELCIFLKFQMFYNSNRISNSSKKSKISKKKTMIH